MGRAQWRISLYVVLLLSLTVPAAADTWVELAPMPYARAEPAVAAIDEKVYVFGGHDHATGATFDSVQVYGPSTDTWEVKNSMPGPRRNSAVAVAGDTVYVLGGQTTGSTKFRTTWVYDPSSDTWASGSDIPGSYHDGGRCDASAISVGGEIWLVGGYDGAAQLSRVDIYDPVADSWRSGPSLTQPAQSPMLFEHGGLLYALHTMWAGGVEVCDLHAASPSWTEISDLGELYWAVWARVADKIYGIGYRDHHEVIVYDIPANSWSYADPSPPEYPVWATHAATIGNTVYIPGGLGETTTTDRLLAYTPHPVCDNDLIAFESDRSGNLDIWTIWSDGSHLTQITTDPARDSEPAWSPDGKKIAFSSHRGGSADIWVIDAQTRDLWQITSDAVDEIAATWSPDGTRVAYWHDYTSVRIVDVSDLGNPGTSTLLTEKHAMEPDWCVNGYIAFQSNHGHWGVYSIWAKKPDTGHEYEVVQYVGGAGAYDPAWSPDGLELAYTNLQTGSASSHNEDIFVSPKDGPLPNLGEQITSDSVIGNTGTEDRYPDWSPSGHWIYFTRHVHGSPVGEADIWLVNRDGTGLTNITNRPEGRDSYGSVTAISETPPPPDLIAFESDRAGNRDIWTIWSDGTHLTQITTDPADDRYADWSPDGTKIAFSSERSGNPDLWVIEPDSGLLWQITSHPADDSAPAWSPEGDRLAFQSNRGITHEIWVVDVSDLESPGAPAKLTDYDPGSRDLEGESDPDWCVNGYIAYHTERNHMWLWSAWATDPDTGDEYEVVSHVGGAGAYYPAWSPDGEWVVYSNLQSGSPSSHNDDLYVAPKDGALPNLGEPLTSDSVIGNTGVADYHPTWSPSGSRIYFTRIDYDTGAQDVLVVNRDGTGLRNITNRPDGNDSWPSVRSLIEYECLPVEIDIKPGSERNPINPKSRGVVPVAVFSSESFDATDIDPSTVLLAGGPVGQSPDGGRYLVHEQDVDGDGLMDLRLHFDTEEMDEEELATGWAMLVGSTYGDICFEGQDNVTVVPHDIPNDHWAIEYIVACMNADTVYGYTDGTYQPTWEVGRDQMAAFVSRATAGGDDSVPDPVADPTFPDVPDDHWAYSYIEYVVSAEIVEGYPDGEYKPAEVVTRDQMAVYIARARGWLGMEDPLDTAPEVFPDVPAGHWAGEAIAECLDHGVVKGYGDGSYLPDAAVSRDQMAAYISRAFEFLN